jgi:hypothetical protein
VCILRRYCLTFKSEIKVFFTSLSAWKSSQIPKRKKQACKQTLLPKMLETEYIEKGEADR